MNKQEYLGALEKALRLAHGKRIKGADRYTDYSVYKSEVKHHSISQPV